MLQRDTGLQVSLFSVLVDNTWGLVRDVLSTSMLNNNAWRPISSCNIVDLLLKS